MKQILLLLLTLVYLDVLAPMNRELYVLRAESVKPYERLVRAIVAVESDGNPWAYNPDGESVGAFQIRQCKLDDFNKLTGKNYQLEDMFRYDKAKEVFIYFACESLDFEFLARKWNGSGPMTDKYWELVKQKL
jgi:hypothetical protein